MCGVALDLGHVIFGVDDGRFVEGDNVVGTLVPHLGVAERILASGTMRRDPRRVLFGIPPVS